jgi:ATP-dependent helicase/nuclease subunit B
MTQLPLPSTPPSAPPPLRVFPGWSQPALRTVATGLVERSLADDAVDVVDLSGLRLVLPGARAQRRLLELLLDEAEARGRALLPPDMVTAGRLPERLYAPTLPPPPPEVEEAAWRRALRELAPEALQRVVPLVPGADEAGSWTALAVTVADLHAQVGAEGHTFEDVALRCRGELLFNDEERWHVLAEAQRRLRRLLHDAGYRDREGARLDALAEGIALPAGGPSTLVLVGLVDLPGVVRRFITAWPGQVEAWIHAPAELAPRFDSLGVVDPDAWDDVRLPLPAENLRVVSRPDEQAAVVEDVLRGLAGRRAAEEITVGVPDPQVVPHLVGRLEGAGVATRVAGGRPLHRTAPFRLLEAVADLLDGWSYEDFATLVRHPDLPWGLLSGLPARAQVPPAAVADEYHALHLPAVLSGYLPAGESSGERPGGGPGYRRGAPSGALLALRDALQRGVATLVAPPGQAPHPPRRMAAWAEPLRAFLVALYPDGDGGDGGRRLDRQARQDRDLVAFAQAAQRVLEGFEALPEALDPDPVAAQHALRALLARLRDTAVPPEADEGAVELLGWLELHLDDAEVLVVTGVNEPFLPESVTGDPFLPHELRRRLGLVDNRRRRARDLYLLSAILASRPGTLLVAGRRDAEGNPLRPSRLLLADTPEAVARRVVDLLGGTEAPPAAGKRPSIETSPDGDMSSPTPFTLPPEPVLSAPGGPPSALAVTQFRRLLVDPYRYALEQILGLEAVNDEARELDPMGFGILAHEVLERWARVESADRMTEEEILQALNAGLDTRFADRFGSRPLPALRLQREQLRMRLRGFAALQAARNAQGWQIRGVEIGPVGEGVPFEVDGSVIFLRGRIDRVDYHPERRIWQLLDLKTSETASPPDQVHRRGRGAERRWVDLQLPLYRILARGLLREGATLLPPGAVLETGYLLLPGGGDAAVALADWTDAELDDAREAAFEVVRLLRRNRFVWDPATSTIGPGDPLAPVVGRGVLQLDDDGEAGPGDSEGGGDA